MFKRTTILLFTLALSFALTACLGGGTTEPTRYYTIAIENIQNPSASSFKDKRLQVRKFTIEPAYQRTNIVYRESAYDFMFYDLDLWASRPEHMLAQVAGEYLTRAGIFKSVETKTNGKPDYELLGNIIAIEEIDEGSSQYARLAIQLTFRKTESDEALWEKTFDQKKSMDNREPRTTAETLSKLFGEYMEEALNEISSRN
ncbi:ABC-type transport auxiliary lipoprotein family protein [Fibrobacter sp.]|uniref:ABC-type transport auxiliary lipoprotein family protein n=1 Tax=Fibrobacter sp. TaxID=35828 RepID=UPI00386954B1